MEKYASRKLDLTKLDKINVPIKENILRKEKSWKYE